MQTPARGDRAKQEGPREGEPTFEEFISNPEFDAYAKENEISLSGFRAQISEMTGEMRALGALLASVDAPKGEAEEAVRERIRKLQANIYSYQNEAVKVRNDERRDYERYLRDARFSADNLRVAAPAERIEGAAARDFGPPEASDFGPPEAGDLEAPAPPRAPHDAVWGVGVSHVGDPEPAEKPEREEWSHTGRDKGAGVSLRAPRNGAQAAAKPRRAERTFFAACFEPPLAKRFDPPRDLF